MSNREEMLDRVRKALGRQPGVPPPQPAEIPGKLTGVMPPIPPQELLSKFEVEMEALGGETYRASTPEALDQIVRSILDSCRAMRIVLSKNPILAQLGLQNKLSKGGKLVTAWGGEMTEGGENSFRQECFAAEIGMTGVDFVLAETGSLVLTSLSEGSQLSSLAPPVHVALYRRDQLRASLDEVLEALPVSRNPNQPASFRSVVFVTGTSRTADIEQILVRGVHGPREVHAVLIEETCLVQSSSAPLKE